MKTNLEVFIEFDGNTKEAYDFYQKTFNTEAPEIMRVKDAPSPEGMENMDPEAVMYAGIKIGESIMMGSDNFDGPYEEPKGIYLTYSSSQSQEVDRIWNEFKEAGSQVIMDLGETFFAKKYGILKDPYGVSWMILLYEEN